MNLIELEQLFDRYMSILESTQELDQALLVITEKDEWCEALFNRAEKLRTYSVEANDIVRRFVDFTQEEWTAEQADIVYEKVRSMYMSGMDDTEVLLPLLEKAADFFRKTKETEKLFRMLYELAYEKNEVLCRRDATHNFREEDLLEIISYKDQYTSLPDICRILFWNAYMMLVTISEWHTNIDNNYVDKWYLEMMQTAELPDIKALDGENPDVLGVILQTKYRWISFDYHFEDKGDPALRDCFFQTIQFFVDMEKEESGDDELLYDYRIFEAYIALCFYKKELTSSEVLSRLKSYYSSYVKKMISEENFDDERIMGLLNIPSHMITFAADHETEEFCCALAEELRNTFDNCMPIILHHSGPDAANHILSLWCDQILPFIKDPSEKEDTLMHLVVKRQLHTMIHSTMVSKLALVLFDAAIADEPLLFDAVPLAPNELRAYVKYAALFHDIGKISIPDVITLQYRRLGNAEFSGIRKHPLLGKKRFDRDPILCKYNDIVLGHHKSYDGKSGYPADFDNTASPYRIIIDIVTLCDCLDAATDYFGRNYKTVKTALEVFDELRSGKGTMYNPDLVDIILDNRALQQTILALTGPERKNIAYRAYRDRI